MQRIRSEDFHWYRGSAVSPTLPRIVSVDPGHKRTPTGSPSVIQVWAPDRDRFYLLDQWRERARCSDFRSAFLDVCRKHRPNIAFWPCFRISWTADWTDDYVEEFLTFPANCTDQVDATVQFLDKVGSAKWHGLRRPKVAIGAVASHSSPTPATAAPLSRAIGAVACASDWRR